jgi:hypothetical protein
MRAFANTPFDKRLASFLFAYGGVVHLLMFRAFAQPADPEIRAMHSISVGIFLLGGIVVLALFYRPSRRAWTSQASLLSRMALVGALATFLVIEIALVIQALVATVAGWHELRMLPLNEGLGMLGLMVLSVHVYGFVLFVYLLPLGLVQGAVAGLLMPRFRLIVNAGGPS